VPTKLLPYQKKGVLQIERFRGKALLADEMQLGKTIQALYFSRRHPKLTPVVVVCPAISKYVWLGQAHEHVHIHGRILSGKTPPKNLPIIRQGLLIINYEILTQWIDWLIQLNPKLLIIDECHYGKNPLAQRTKDLKRLAQDIPHIIAISGTPLINRPAELWTTLNLLRPDIWPNFMDFGWKYCNPTMEFGKWVYKGANNLPELHQELRKHVMIRRLKKNVMKELPAKTRLVVPLGIANRREYVEASLNITGWLKKFSNKKAKKAYKAARLVRFGYLKRLATKLKMKMVFRWLDNFLENNDDKIVVFAIHKFVIKQLHEKYKNISVVIDGSTSTKKKKIRELTFKTKPNIRMLIGNIQAAGVSISLSREAYLTAFVEVGYTPGEHTQAEDRTHGIGQTKGALYWYLIAKDTIEEDLCGLIQKKQKILSATLDGGENVNELNIFDELEKKLKRKRRKR
jgi:SWI/SNF-related matrix-associated actin-dependent regulator 1 of chromatin subfamily A